MFTLNILTDHFMISMDSHTILVTSISAKIFSSVSKSDRLRPGPTAVTDAKRMKKVKNSCHPFENAMHPLYTYCIRVSYGLSIEHPSILISSAQKFLSCSNFLERMNFPPCTI